MFLEVIYRIYEGTMATKVPTHHPMPNLKIIKIMIYVYMVVMVKMMASMQVLNRIYLF